LSDPTTAEHRRAARHRVLLSGVVAHGPAGMTLDCAVRDLSETGARIRLTSPEDIWPPVALLILKTDKAYEAQIAWRHDNEVGLNFTGPLNVEQPTTELEKTLRRLMMSRRLR
jgi:hypothetical protein